MESGFELVGGVGRERLAAVLMMLRPQARRMLDRQGMAAGSLWSGDLVGEAACRLLRCRRVVEHPDPRYVRASGLRAMRRALAEWIRSRQRRKRGGRWSRIPLDESAIPVVDRGERPSGGEMHQSAGLAAIEAALARLAEADPKVARAVQLFYVEGKTVAATAEAMRRSPRMVDNYLAAGRLWLRRELGRGSQD